MIEDVLEPLSLYRDRFRKAFAQATEDKFLELTRQAGVDVEANREAVKAVHRAESDLEDARSRLSCRKGLLAFCIVVAVIALLVLALGIRLDADGGVLLLAGAAFILGGGGIFGCAQSLSGLRAAVDEAESRLRSALQVARDQMKALNELFTWDIPVKLIEQVVPKISFDPYFADIRLDALRRLYGWNDAFNEGKSMLFAQSGVILGNPFVVGEYLDQTWEPKTYSGSLDISWTEWVSDSDGNEHPVSRRQTLHATVEKPVPVYGKHKFLLYGNDAAPNLTFTREPSPHSGKEGYFARKGRERELKKLRKFSQKLGDESQYTLMANHDFEVLFHAVDRDHEVEFRLLFTALAQSQMLALLNDTTVGYGDDFCFIKDHKINLIAAEHLDEGPIDTDPERFRSYDWDASHAVFTEFNNRYFKDLFFAFAPLLAVPLYQQTRSHEEIWKGIVDTEPSCFWEHEAVANYHGEEAFRHPDCITHSILKTKLISREDGESAVAVTAHGFRGVERRDFVSVHGGDGDWHDVPVDWIEYLPVSNTRSIRLTERTRPSENFQTKAAESVASILRRTIHSYLPAKTIVVNRPKKGR